MAFGLPKLHSRNNACCTIVICVVWKKCVYAGSIQLAKELKDGSLIHVGLLEERCFLGLMFYEIRHTLQMTRLLAVTLLSFHSVPFFSV